MKAQAQIEQCPEFKFFGANYPDARCVKGQLYDLDKCDENGNLYEPSEVWPCPFCNTKEFINQYSENTGMSKNHVRKIVNEFKKNFK